MADFGNWDKNSKRIQQGRTEGLEVPPEGYEIPGPSSGLLQLGSLAFHGPLRTFYAEVVAHLEDCPETDTQQRGYITAMSAIRNGLEFENVDDVIHAYLHVLTHSQGDYELECYTEEARDEAVASFASTLILPET